MKSSMVEPSLYGYYKIGEECFLVRSEVLEGCRALHMFKFIDEGIPEEESIIPDAIKHVPSLILDRRSEISIGVDELSSSGVPINVFHSLLFRRRECVYFKGMTNVYRISHEYLLHSIHRFIAYCAVRFRLQEHFHCRKFFNHMEPSRKRDRREYQMGRYDAKKQKCMDKNREKLERYYMGKEDINALTLPSADRAFPSPLYFPPSDMEDAMEENAVEPVEPRYAEGDILLIEANTKERGYVHLRFLFYFFFSLRPFVSLLGTKQKILR